MNKAKLNGLLHVIAQLLAQGAVMELVPLDYKPVFSAIIAVIGVLVAFSDQTLSS